MECLYERLLNGVLRALSGMSPESEKEFIAELEKTDSELAGEINNRLYKFADIALLDDRSVQKMLREVEMEELAVGLKGAEQEVVEKILRNMSQRAGGLLKEELEYMGPVKKKKVEENQLKIVSVIRMLENKGEIPAGISKDDELVE